LLAPGARNASNSEQNWSDGGPIREEFLANVHTHSHEQRKSIKNTRLFDDSPPQGRGHQKRRFAAFAFQKYDFKLKHQKHELF